MDDFMTRIGEGFLRDLGIMKDKHGGLLTFFIGTSITVNSHRFKKLKADSNSVLKTASNVLFLNHNSLTFKVGDFESLKQHTGYLEFFFCALKSCSSHFCCIMRIASKTRIPRRKGTKEQKTCCCNHNS